MDDERRDQFEKIILSERMRYIKITCSDKKYLFNKLDVFESCVLDFNQCLFIWKLRERASILINYPTEPGLVQLVFSLLLEGTNDFFR